jgi:CHAD domain-containing protein
MYTFARSGGWHDAVRVVMMDVCTRKGGVEQAMDDVIERERKFDVPVGWQLPDPGPLLPNGGDVREEVVQLRSAYYDTADYALARSGVTLRRRTGDTDTGWHLKVPGSDFRTEIRLPVDEPTVPDELTDLVRGLTGGADLRLVATLDTERHVLHLMHDSGVQLAEIADDRVTAVATGDAAAIQQWREIEIELGDGDMKFLDRSARWLTKSGAEPARSASKLARAIEVPTDAGTSGGHGLAGLLQSYLHDQYRAIVSGDIALRRDGDVVHPTRVATRRFRSVLRTFAEVFDDDAAARMDSELQWYAGRLGAVRDVQVMRKHLTEAQQSLPTTAASGATASYLARTLDEAERTARAALDTVLAGDRYARMLHDIRTWLESNPVRSDRPSADVKFFVDAARRKLAKQAARAAKRNADDAAMHRARKAAKRARYTAEVAEPVLGKPAHRAVNKLKKAQDRFGLLQDAVVAGEFLHRSAAQAEPPAAAFDLGVLWCREEQRAADARAAGRKLAKRLSR